MATISPHGANQRVLLGPRATRVTQTRGISLENRFFDGLGS